jgi:hypothetical protein
MLSKHLTRENHQELFAAARGLSRSAVAQLLAVRFPEPDVPASIRKLPAPAPAPVVVPASAPPMFALAAPAGSHVAVGPLPPPAPLVSSVPTPPATHPVMRPLAADRYELRLTVKESTRENLQMAQDLLRHALPSGDSAEILDRALAMYVEHLVKAKFKVTKRPRRSRGQQDDSRNVPAEVKRAVYVRDRGRCTYLGTGGHRCGERGFLEFHHANPYGARGRPTVDNIHLRCRAHNRYEAEVFYGPGRQYGGVDVVREEPARYGVLTQAQCITGFGTGRFETQGRQALSGPGHAR